MCRYIPTAKLQTMDDWGLMDDQHQHNHVSLLGNVNNNGGCSQTAKLDQLIEDLREIGSSQPSSPYSSPVRLVALTILKCTIPFLLCVCECAAVCLFRFSRMEMESRLGGGHTHCYTHSLTKQSHARTPSQALLSSVCVCQSKLFMYR